MVHRRPPCTVPGCTRPENDLHSGACTVHLALWSFGQAVRLIEERANAEETAEFWAEIAQVVAENKE